MTEPLEQGEKREWPTEGFDLTRVTIGLGWDLRKPEAPKNILEKLLGKPDPVPFDLDAIALLLDGNGRLANLGHKRSLPDGKIQHMVDSDIIFYDNLHHPSGHIWHTGDSTEGKAGRDAEQILVNLQKLPSNYQSIIFLAAIYRGLEKGQDFGHVSNAYIRAVDANGKEMARFQLSADPVFGQMRAVTFAQVFRKGNGWEFVAIGKGHEKNDLQDLLRGYVYY